MAKPLISIIMPVYNAAQYLETAINSVLNQTFGDFEIICVNDCSKDNSLEILQALSKKDNRIIIINSPENVGAGEARNLALNKVAGKYITFIDSDDTISPDLYESVYNLAESCNADEVVWGVTEKHYDKKDRYKGSVLEIPEKNIATTKTDVMEMLLSLEKGTLFGYQCNSLYKADIIKDNNIKFEKALFYEDFFFNLEFVKHSKILATLDHGGYYYFKRINNSITNRFSKDYYNLSYRRIQETFDFFRDNNYINSNVYNVLGDKLLRYTLSAVCRNFYVQSMMNGKERKQWFKNCCEKPLYQIILPNSKPSHPAYKILKFAIEKNNYTLAGVVGKFVSVLKR